MKKVRKHPHEKHGSDSYNQKESVSTGAKEINLPAWAFVLFFFVGIKIGQNIKHYTVKEKPKIIPSSVIVTPISHCIYFHF